MLFLVPSLPVDAEEIKIDGVLDEGLWSTAREWTKYFESIPFSLAEPKHVQKVLILEDEKGMYFGFITFIQFLQTLALGLSAIGLLTVLIDLPELIGWSDCQAVFDRVILSLVIASHIWAFRWAIG